MDKKKRPAQKKLSKKSTKPKSKKAISKEIVPETTLTASNAASFSFSAEFDPSAATDPYASSGASSSTCFTLYPSTPWDDVKDNETKEPVKGVSLLDKIGTTFRKFIDRLRTGCGRGGEEENSIE